MVFGLQSFDMVSFRKWWDAVGVGGIIIIGLALFFFPEPITSVIGILIIAIAAILWLGGWYTGRNSNSDTDE